MSVLFVFRGACSIAGFSSVLFFTPPPFDYAVAAPKLSSKASCSDWLWWDDIILRNVLKNACESRANKELANKELAATQQPSHRFAMLAVIRNLTLR